MSVPAQPPASPPTSHASEKLSSAFSSSFATFSLNHVKYYVFTSSDLPADHLSVTFASGRLVLSYDGSFSALRPAEVREGDRALYADYILTALQRQHTAGSDTGGGLYGYDWKDDTRSTSPRATLTIARTFGQYTVNIAIIHLTPVIPPASPSPSPSPSSSSSTSAYCRSLFPLLHTVRAAIVALQQRDKRVRERSKRQAEQLALIELMLDDKGTEAEAVEEEWLGVCMRLVNAEKAKIREVRARTEQVERDTKLLTAKEAPAAKEPRSDSDSDVAEEKEEVKRAEMMDLTETKEDDGTAEAQHGGPALSLDSAAMELSLHPDSASPPHSLSSMPSLQPDSNVNTQRSSSTSSSLTSSSSQSRMSGGLLLDSGEPSRRSVRKRARMQPPTASTSSAASSQSIPSTLSLSSSLNGANRLLPPLSSVGDKFAAPSVRALSPAASVGAAADGRQIPRPGVTALLDEL